VVPGNDKGGADMLFAAPASVASQKRDEAYRLAIASDDRLFHYYLYDWHNESGYQERLLDVSAAYSRSGD
jgi:nuclear pore complex protein Nup155